MERRGVGAVLVVVGLVLAGCGSDDQRTSPPTTVAETLAPTTTWVTTTPSTSSTTPSTTTTSTSTTAPVFQTPTMPLIEFAGTCVEQAATREAPTLDEARLDTFGPLGVAPAIEFPIPDGPPLPEGVVPQTNVNVTRIPGGVLVHTAAGYGNTERILTAIDLDGTVRWQRCFDGGSGSVIAAAASAGPTEVLVSDDRRTDGTQISTFSVISLADGRETGQLDDIIAAADLPTSGQPLALGYDNRAGAGRRTVLLSPENGPEPDMPVVLLDLVDMSVTTVPFPPEPAFEVSTPGYVVFDAQDRLLRVDVSTAQGNPVVTAILLDGDWVTDEAVLAAEVPVEVSPYIPFETSIEGFHSLKATDHTGALAWERDDVMIIDSEGFWFGTVDDIAVAISCIEPVFEGFPSCDAGFRTGAYDLATGETIWERDGYHGSAIAGDGHMLAPIADGGWEMLDVRTGERVQTDQVWDAPFTFSTECCGGDTTQRAERHGGIVFTVSDGMARIYLPQWASHPTVSLALI